MISISVSTMRTVERQRPHVHHWIIEEPNGPQSKGKCKLCHRTAIFSNGGVEWGSKESHSGLLASNKDTQRLSRTLIVTGKKG